MCLEIFRFQHENNPVYREFVSRLGRSIADVTNYKDIPFLPIELFKSRKIYAAQTEPELVFESSGTTGSIPSRHLVADSTVYQQSFHQAFELFYGPVEEYCILALLPSYLERGGSSLVYMVNDLIQKGGHPKSGFYLDNQSELIGHLAELEAAGQKTLLIGVSFALLDLVEKHQFSLKHTTTVMETGGMKGRRKELVRAELHQILTTGFGVERIHSEYGMTELLSQSYSDGAGIFTAPPWMKIRIRDAYDPLSYKETGRTGGVNVIDLANIYSCSFVATNDLGRLHENETFEVMGRFDNSDLRGCNLLVAI